MVSREVTIEPATSIVDAARRMIQEERGPLPVVEGDSAVAMVTDRDVIARVVAESRDPNSVRVEDIATHELVTIGPDQDVEEARQLMDQHELDRTLVVEGDGSVGTVSKAEIRCDEEPPGLTTSWHRPGLWAPEQPLRPQQPRCRPPDRPARRQAGNTLGGRMDYGERITGTRDEHYDLVSVLYHALQGAENCDRYAADAEVTGEEHLEAARIGSLLFIFAAPPHD